MTRELFHLVELEQNLNITADIYTEDRHDKQKKTCYSVCEKKKLSNLIIIDVTKEITLGEERIYFSQHFIHLSHTYYVYDIQTITK